MSTRFSIAVSHQFFVGVGVHAILDMADEPLALQRQRHLMADDASRRKSETFKSVVRIDDRRRPLEIACGGASESSLASERSISCRARFATALVGRRRA